MKQENKKENIIEDTKPEEVKVEGKAMSEQNVKPEANVKEKKAKDKEETTKEEAKGASDKPIKEETKTTSDKQEADSKDDELTADKEIKEKEEKEEPEVRKIRTVHGQQIDLEEVKEKEEGLKFNSFKERMEYYWDYYKWTVGVAAVLVIITLTLVRAVMIEMKPPIIYIAMMNAHMDTPADATFGDDYGNQRGLDPKSGRITMDTDFVHPMTVDDAALKNDTVIASMQRFTAAVTNANIDIAITNPWVLKDYMENEIFYNLQEIYTPEEIDAFEKADLLWYEPDSTGTLVPVGVKINGHRDIDSFYDDGEVVVIGIPRDSKRVERAKDFVAWMLEG